MDYQPDKHHRQTIRLRLYDYCSLDEYFVAHFTHECKNRFGHLDKAQMALSDCGHIVCNDWLNTTNVRSGAVLDELVYYQHIIRNEDVLNGLRLYIQKTSLQCLTPEELI